MELLPEGDLADLSTLAIVKQLRSDIELLLSQHFSQLRSDLQHHHKQLTSSTESLEGCARQLSVLVESGSSAILVGQPSTSTQQIGSAQVESLPSHSLFHPCEVSHYENPHQKESMYSPLQLTGSGIEKRGAGSLTEKIWKHESEKQHTTGIVGDMVSSAVSQVTGHSKFEKKEEQMNDLKRTMSKFQHDGKHADDYITAHSRKLAEKAESTLERLVTSPHYDGASALVIIVNSVMMVLHTQHVAHEMLDGRGKAGGGQMHWLAFSVVFAILFSIDILLRWYIDGFTGFFRTEARWWNIFDVVIVSFSVADLLYGAFSDEVEHTGVSVLRVLRVIRIVRVLRIIRVLRFFQELRLMLHSLLQCILSVVWAAVVFALIFAIFGIIFTSATVEYCKQGSLWQDASTEALRDAFGTLDRSAISLFMSISGGRNWGDYYHLLKVLPRINVVLYILFIMFFIVAAMNVITGIFVENAREAAELDRSFLIHEELEEKQKYVKAMDELFQELDVSGRGGITLAELEAHLEDERAIAYLNALDVDFTEARSLFALLDVDRSGVVNFDEFLHGCEKLRGEAKSIDIALLHCEIRWLSRAVFDIQETSQKSQGKTCSLAETSINEYLAKTKTQQYIEQAQAKPVDKLPDGCKSTDGATLVSVVPKA